MGDGYSVKDRAEWYCCAFSEIETFSAQSEEEQPVSEGVTQRSVEF
jgi:hypothetical protein